MKRTFLVVSSLITVTSVASPTVTAVSFEQNRASKIVDIRYSLSDAAIVTVDILTNGVSVGGRNLRNLAGDVNTEVAAGVRRVTWRPWEGWPEGPAKAEITAKVTAWPLWNPPDYLVVDLVEPYGHKYYPDEDFLPGGVTGADYRETKMVMRHIRAAGETFRMGLGANEPSASLCQNSTKANMTPHRVTLTNDFWLGVFEVTRAQFDILKGSAQTYNGTAVNVKSGEKAAWLPADKVVIYNELRGTTYYWPQDGYQVADDSIFGQLRGKTGVRFDLPTQAEWEFSCRAGTTTQFYSGKDLCDVIYQTNDGKYLMKGVDDILWRNSNNQPQCVGKLKPNAWGLYDMLGNEMELVLDAASSTTGVMDDRIAPCGGSGHEQRTRCGGCCNDSFNDSRKTFCLASGTSSISAGSGNNYTGARFKALIPMIGK